MNAQSRLKYYSPVCSSNIAFLNVKFYSGLRTFTLQNIRDVISLHHNVTCQSN